jgi:hypothetical protein
MKRTAAVILLVVVGIGFGSARAEQAEPPKRINAAFQTPPNLIIRSEELFPLTPPTRLGMLTLVPPENNGEVVRVSVPVGEGISKAARAISNANHRRGERKADERVRKDLEQFIAAAANRKDGTEGDRGSDHPPD